MAVFPRLAPLHSRFNCGLDARHLWLCSAVSRGLLPLRRWPANTKARRRSRRFACGDVCWCRFQHHFVRASLPHGVIATPSHTVNDTLSSTPKPLAILSSAALSLAALQFVGTVGILAYVSFVRSQETPHEVEWGEGVGAIIFIAALVVANMALVVVGLILTLLSLWRQEKPIWLRETALAIYGPAALLVVGLVIWRLLPQ